ncbi:MAG: SDR family oxidoreductase [Bacillaceae bacterium]|nr:SDR family oxidoreductase [Bacillaceae bacterium]
MEPRFEGTVSVVTGAGSGIGEYTARRLAREGARVVLVGRTAARLEQVAHQINGEQAEPVADIFPADVTREEDVNRLKDHISRTYGDLHVLVNNAGSSGQSRIMDLTAEEWDRIQQVNVKSVFLVSRALGALMMAGRQREPEAGQSLTNRSIVNVASLSGHKPGAQIPHYSASKAAVINLTRALALELAPYQIRVNSVSPGFVETPLTAQGLKNERFQKAIQRNTALGRVGKPEEIANIIAFVASGEASYMTGSDVLADGGWLIT